MTKEDESRRAFLKGAAAGAGAAATAALVPAANAQTLEKQSSEAMQALPAAQKHGAFFNDEEAATISAFSERLMPGAPGKPGAHDANVLNYIDLALAGAYADQQEFYRHGLYQLDAYCRKVHGQAFRQLPAARQDETIAALEEGKAEGFSWPTAKAFFDTLRTHTMEGMFADPIYGGNKDFAGWKLVGFPGAQPQFTARDIGSRQAFTREPILGLQATAKTTKKG
jgi:gluconate 2-dehydrogenase gamma chain